MSRRTKIRMVTDNEACCDVPDLERVGCDFVGEADAAALLLQVDDYARRVLLQVPHRQPQLIRAVALQRPQYLCEYTYDPVVLSRRCMQVSIVMQALMRAQTAECAASGEHACSRMVIRVGDQVEAEHRTKQVVSSLNMHT